MSSQYTKLTDEELIKEAIEHVKVGNAVPTEMEDRLRLLGMYELICFPLSLDIMGE